MWPPTSNWKTIAIGKMMLGLLAYSCIVQSKIVLVRFHRLHASTDLIRYGNAIVPGACPFRYRTGDRSGFRKSEGERELMGSRLGAAKWG